MRWLMNKMAHLAMNTKDNHTEERMIIYKTTNLVSGKIYIGQTRKSDPNYYGSGTKIKDAIKVYGRENFKREILEECENEEELNKREEHWIDYYNSTNPEIGYNLLFGGNNYSLDNNPNGDLIRDKISKNHAKYWLGKKQPKEMVEKRRQSILGKPSKKKGKPISEETKLKISKNNARYWQGKHIPEEVKEKIRKKRAKQDMSHLHAKYTLIHNDGKIYNIDGVTEFLREHNLSKTQFYRLIRGEIKEYKGFSLDN